MSKPRFLMSNEAMANYNRERREVAAVNREHRWEQERILKKSEGLKKENTRLKKQNKELREQIVALKAKCR